VLLPFASIADWPSYRGPGATGIGSGDPPITWDVKTGKNVAWTTPIPGLAHSSVVVQGDRVYLTTAVSAAGKQSLRIGMYGSGGSAADKGELQWILMCLERSTGKILWQQTVHTGKPIQARHAKASHANSTPAVQNNRVVAMLGSEGLYCYDTNGKHLWKTDLGLLHAGPYNSPSLQWGFASSPVIHDGKVIMQCDVLNDGFVSILDLETGKEIRRIKRPHEVATWSTACIWPTPNGVQIICNGYKHIGAYDLETGKELWRLRGGGDIPVPTPFVADGLVYVTNAHGRMSPIYAVTADARGDLTPTRNKPLPKGLAWWMHRGGSYIPTPIVVDGRLFVANDRGILTCLDAKTGTEHYKRRIVDGGNDPYSASPVSAAGRLYVTGEYGTIRVLSAGKTFELLASNDMDDVCMATPAIENGQIFIRTRSALVCVQKQ
jgi:outer membrane protein assembly factor BamB